MSDHIQKTIAELQRHMQSLEDEIADTKRTINSLCKTTGSQPLYASVDAKSAIVGGPMRSDLYYGKPLAVVVRSILEARQSMNIGPATVAEIYDQMVEGGYVFDGANIDNRKRVLRISLAKNTAVFHKLPNGSYGLLEWYPAAKASRKNGASKTAVADDDIDDVEESDSASEDDTETVAAGASELHKKKPR